MEAPQMDRGVWMHKSLKVRLFLHKFQICHIMLLLVNSSYQSQRIVYGLKSSVRQLSIAKPVIRDYFRSSLYPCTMMTILILTSATALYIFRICNNRTPGSEQLKTLGKRIDCQRENCLISQLRLNSGQALKGFEKADIYEYSGRYYLLAQNQNGISRIREIHFAINDHPYIFAA